MSTFSPQARGWTRAARADEVPGSVFPAGAGMDLSVIDAWECASGFPRRRGDGPQICEDALPRMMFSPQARGWTDSGPVAEPVDRVFPAGAGMDRRGGVEGGGQHRFPRRRGDGPSPVGARSHRSWFSPQARGWTRAPASPRRRRGVFPAGAGMDRSCASCWTASTSFPRRRGDGPPRPGSPRTGCTFSPQARGWTPRWSRCPRRAGVFPAGAGMDPARRDPSCCRRSFPRRRGDGPLGHGGSPSGRVFPAGAGMDLCGWRATWAWMCFPRRRRDGPTQKAIAAAVTKFSPQARGWTPHARVDSGPSHVFPAGAGMDPLSRTRGASSASFPRRRGDGPRRRIGSCPAPPFSPQARGWTCTRCVRSLSRGVFPAGAGMDPGYADGLAVLRRFPRRRGDGPFGASSRTHPSQFSPQARGWTSPMNKWRFIRFVFPAGAGMDPSPRFSSPAAGGFPRRRGDGPCRKTGSARSLPFSPQARGWTAVRLDPQLPEDVFPAGAGMDPCPRRKCKRCQSFPRRRGDGPLADFLRAFHRLFSPQARGWTACTPALP